MIIEIEDYVQHHGVKGMRWGVVNEDKSGGRSSGKNQPSRRERRVKKFEAKASSAQAKIDELSAKPKTTSLQKALANKKTIELKEEKRKAETNAQLVREGKMTPGRKKALIGAAVAGTLVASYGTYVALDSGEFNRSMMKGKAFLTGQKGLPWAKNANLSKSMSPDELLKNVVRPINSDYGALGTKMNCRRCTYAYEMRRRGYDVMATRTPTARGQTIFGTINAASPGGDIITNKYEALYKFTQEKAKAESGIVSTTKLGEGLRRFTNVGENVIRLGTGRSEGDEIFESLIKNNPNGARGEVTMLWGMGGGHSIAWEIVNNRPVVFDTQSGKKFLSGLDLEKEYGQSIAEAGFTRLDNMPLNDDFLMRWLKNA